MSSICRTSKAFNASRSERNDEPIRRPSWLSTIYLVQAFVTGPDLMRDRGAVEDLAKLKGGFSIAGSDIAYVEASENGKWGMGGITHCGRFRIGLTNGKWREYGRVLHPHSLQHNSG
jgi:hypothetical protein